MSTMTERSSIGTFNLGQILAHEARLNGLHRLFKSHFNVPEPSLILEPYLYLGNCISAHDVYRLSRLGIRYILNVAKRDVELCPYYSKDMRILTIDLRDDDQENILRIFDQAFAFIDEARKANSRVLVHCSHGQSRSPAIVIAYLMRTYHVPLEQCLTHVVKARPCVIPNDGFLKQLILFDRVLVDRRRHHHHHQQQQQQQQHQQQQQQQRQQQQQKNQTTMQTIQSNKSAAIAIQYHPSGTPHPVPPPPIATKSNSSPRCQSSASTTIRVTSVDSSVMKLSPKTNVQSSSIRPSSSSKSIQMIPVQISPKKERNSAKVKRVSGKKVPTDNITVVENVNKKVDKLDKHVTTKSSKIPSKPRLKISSSHSDLLTKKKSSSKKTEDSGPYTPLMQRSHTDHTTPTSTEHNLKKPPRQQMNFNHYYPQSYYGSLGYLHTNYITEIYDRVAKRFVPTTSCF